MGVTQWPWSAPAWPRTAGGTPGPGGPAQRPHPSGPSTGREGEGATLLCDCIRSSALLTAPR